MFKTFFFVSIWTMIFLVSIATSIFAQCGPDGTQPCTPTPKKAPPKNSAVIKKPNITNPPKSKNSGVANSKTVSKKSTIDYFEGASKCQEEDSACKIEVYTKAIQTGYKLAAAYYNRGDIYFLKGDYESAIQDYNMSIKLDPTNAEAFFSRGSAFYNINDNQRTMSDVNKVIELAPRKFDGAYAMRAAIYYEQGNYDQALKDYTKAIEIYPTWYIYYRDRAQVYRKLGRESLAEADEKKAKELGDGAKK